MYVDISEKLGSGEHMGTRETCCDALLAFVDCAPW